ncbi:galactose-3-O-sulfotransferase 3-like isoform X1 [Planococcus citri]|uniref:galactose-3-O-sulfotransferase 3-like isoform X1 n=1 Tax=Planococcus citri TaxID=170843 RepID=UPI0031F75AEF
MKNAMAKSHVFISKYKLEFFYICGFVLLQIFLYRTWIIATNKPTLSIKDEPTFKTKEVKSLVYHCCTPSNNNSIRTNVYFIKTHKTGSTTVQSVILRFAKKKSLSVMNLKYESYLWPLSNWSIFQNTLTANGKYHVLAQHTRYNSSLKSYQYPDTSMVTILRHPVTVFSSIYHYFKMDNYMGMTFRQFLSKPVKPSRLYGIDSNFAYRGYNQMSVDLGFDIKQSENDTAIDEFIRKIDREFDLVMITEYMEESLVLLANLMGWPLEYVAHLNLNSVASKSDSYTLTDHDKDTIMDLNYVDSLLYYHFLKKFRKCVRQYGHEKLNYQVQQLKVSNQQLKERCVADETVLGLYSGSVNVKQYVPKNPFDLECIYSTIPDRGKNLSPEMISWDLFQSSYTQNLFKKIYSYDNSLR